MTRKKRRRKKKKQAKGYRWKDYSKYLQTPHWQRLRERLKRSSRWECYSCGSTERLQVHHKTYDRLGHERLSDLVVLCEICHSKIHTGELSIENEKVGKMERVHVSKNMVQCRSYTIAGTRCRGWAMEGSYYCKQHQKVRYNARGEKV